MGLEIKWGGGGEGGGCCLEEMIRRDQPVVLKK